MILMILIFFVKIREIFKKSRMLTSAFEVLVKMLALKSGVIIVKTKIMDSLPMLLGHQQWRSQDPRLGGSNFWIPECIIKCRIEFRYIEIANTFTCVFFISFYL